MERVQVRLHRTELMYSFENYSIWSELEYKFHKSHKEAVSTIPNATPTPARQKTPTSS